MGNEIRAIMTEKRKEWLTYLLKNGEVRPSSTIVPYQCRKLGWSSFICITPDGRRLAFSEYKKSSEFVAGEFNFSDPIREIITQAGRDALTPSVRQGEER